MENSTPQYIVIIVQVFYAICSLSLLMVALNSIMTISQYLKVRKTYQPKPNYPEPETWPLVTVQLPIYNEQYVLEKLIQSMTAMDYPADRLQIQVLDDSTDATQEAARNLCQLYQAQGVNIEYLHRDNRQGYKAGALAEGLKSATGEFVAIFDADFVPQKDWLKRCVVCFADPHIGFVQTRWTFINRFQNTVTRMASLVLDSHFIIEKVARVENGLIINFNGSAGMWRRKAIDAVGGWQADTLAEDLDLSIRAFIGGWKAVYLRDVTASSEVPVQIDAYKKQQFRWVKGTIQVIRKLFWKLLFSKLPLHTRLVMAINLVAPSWSFPTGLLLQLLFLPIGIMSSALIPLFGWTGASLIGPLTIFAMSKSEDLPRVIDRIKVLPAIFLIGAGVAVNCTLGALSGMVSMGGVFERTPKFNPTEKSANWAVNHYALRVSPMVIGEILVGLYILATLVILWPVMGPILWPWSVISSGGFLLVAAMSLFQELQRWHRQRLAKQKSKAEIAS